MTETTTPTVDRLTRLERIVSLLASNALAGSLAGPAWKALSDAVNVPVAPDIDARDAARRAHAEVHAYIASLERLLAERTRERDTWRHRADVADHAQATLNKRLATTERRISEVTRERERLVDALRQISTWRDDAHAYDEDVGHPPRDFGEGTVEEIENAAKHALAAWSPEVAEASSPSVALCPCETGGDHG